jgi:flagellar protein FliS
VSNPLQAYKKTAVSTANRETLLIMLYEGAIRFLKTAVEAIHAKDLPQKGISIGKAHDIINELSNTLNFEAGGSIAVELERLYNFMVEQMVKANLENTVEPLETTIKLLENLLIGWRGAISQLQSDPGTGQEDP